MTFDPEMALILAADSWSIRTLCKSMGCSTRTLFNKIERDPQFAQDWARARHEGLQLLADDLLTAADGTEDVQRAKLRSENYRWLLARRLVSEYGDRLDLNLNVLDLRGALALANERRVALVQQQQVEDAEWEQLPPPSPSVETEREREAIERLLS